MHRRKFIEKLDLALAGVPFFQLFLSSDLAAKLPRNLKITDLRA